MGRSLKKGPFADASLLKKVDAQKDNEKKTVIRPGHAVPRFTQASLVTLSPFTMVASTCQFTYKKIW